MRTSSFLIRGAAAVLCLLGLLSCEKDFTGKAIRFNARTRQGASSTRTAYSGETYEQSGKTMERIDWLVEDKIVLAMKNDGVSQASQVYAIDGESITSSNQISEAGVVPYGSESGLQWGSGTHDFWAGYPSTVTVGDHTLSSSIPAAQIAEYTVEAEDVIRFEQDMSKAFMVAGLQSEPSDAGINLDFYPAFTTFDITVGANTEITIDHFVMETTTYRTQVPGDPIPLSGNVLATFNPAGGMSYSFSETGTTSSVEVTFKDRRGNTYHPIISQTTSMNFKVFAVPRDITGLRITFFLGDGRTFSLNMKESGDWITFPATTKTNISGLLIPGATWYIHFDYPREEQWVLHPDIEIGVE